MGNQTKNGIDMLVYAKSYEYFIISDIALGQICV